MFWHLLIPQQELAAKANKVPVAPESLV